MNIALIGGGNIGTLLVAGLSSGFHRDITAAKKYDESLFFKTE